MNSANWGECLLAIVVVSLYYVFILSMLSEPGSYKQRWAFFVARTFGRIPVIIRDWWNKIIYKFRRLD